MSIRASTRLLTIGLVAGLVVAAQWTSGAAMAPLDTNELGMVGPATTLPWLAAGLGMATLAVVRSPWILAALAPLFLPLFIGRTPGAWVFAGPAAALLWTIAAAAGWARPAARVEPSLGGPTGRVTPSARVALAPALLATVWLGSIAAAVRPFAMSGDAPHYLTTTQSLVDDGDLDLRNNYDDRTHAPFYNGPLEPRHAITSPWGEEYTFHGLGVSVLVAPAFALWGAGGATWTVVLVMALGSLLVWSAVRGLTSDTGAAWFSWAALTGSAPYAFHSAAVYPDGPAAVTVAGALWLLCRDSRRPVSLAGLAAIGTGLATLPWLHVRLAFPALVFGLACGAIVLRSQPDPWTRLSWLFMAPIISCAGWLASSYVMFETWNPAATMLQRTAPGAFATAPSGVFGMLADQEFGLLPTSPVFLFVPVGVAAVARARPVAAVAGAASVIGLLVMSSLWVWWGGDSAPARFLTVVLPVLAVFLGAAWARASAGWRRVMLQGLAVSVTTTVLMAAVDGGAHAYNYPDGRGAIFEVMSSVVDISDALPSMFRPGATLASELPVALVWLAAVVVAAVITVGWPGRYATRVGLSGLAVALSGCLAASAAWTLRGVDPFTPAIAQGRLAATMASSSPGLLGGVWPFGSRRDLASKLALRTPESVPLGDDVVLHVPNVPAGAYAIRLRPAAHERDVGVGLTLVLGRDAQPFATWPANAVPPQIRLETSVHSVRVLGARLSFADAWLEPLEPPHASRWPPARRVTQVNGLDVYALDDSTYVEPEGIWTGANRPSAMLLAGPDATHVVAEFKAGPADVTLELNVRERATTIAVPAGRSASHPLGLVGVDEPLLLRIVTRGGFPGRDLHAGDSRSLGVLVTFTTNASPKVPSTTK
jgi:hypothetical protein